jgi:hypothetical protein
MWVKASSARLDGIARLEPRGHAPATAALAVVLPVERQKFQRARISSPSAAGRAACRCDGARFFAPQEHRLDGAGESSPRSRPAPRTGRRSERSKRSAQAVLAVAPSTSSADTRSLSPARRTLPATR